MPHVIRPNKLRDLIATGKKALRGDSNDAEHDALHLIVEGLEMIRSQAKGKSKRKSGRSL
jgi:hypothetical protein